MLHAKFQNQRPSCSGEDFLRFFAIYSHGGHLGHVTLTIYINFHSPFLRILNKMFGFDWPSSFIEKRSLNIMVIYVMYIARGRGQTCPWGPFFQNHKYSVHLPISIKFFQSNDILTIFPIQMHGRPMLTLP